MNESKFTPEHAKHLTALICALRPDWDRPGVADAIWKARDKGNALDVCAAAVKACVLSNRTPAVIPLDGNHWREVTPAVSRPRAADKASHCETCGIVHTPLSPCSPPEQRAHGRGAEAARAALAAALGKPDYAGPYTPEETK
jgi:hypothetical protein